VPATALIPLAFSGRFPKLTCGAAIMAAVTVKLV